MARIKIPGFRCEKCGHEWVQRGKREPVQCPKCKSVRFNEPRKEKKTD